MEIKYISGYDGFLQIKRDWEHLYNTNRELTPYQSFEWYESLIKNKIYAGKLLFATLLKNDTVILIAPLVKRGYLLFDEISFLGRNTHADYLNFIYDKNLAFEEFDFFIAKLLHDHSRAVFYLRQINGVSRISKYLQKVKIIRPVETGVCVQIPIYGSVDEYNACLGKSTKKNTRNLCNRVKADFENIEFKFIEKCRLDNNMISTLLNIYMDRSRYKYGYKGLTKKYSTFINSILSTNSDIFLSICYINNKMVAYNLGLYSNSNKICVFMVTMDSEFKKYNIGNILIYKTICYLIEKNHEGSNIIEFYDLTRGAELYKLKYGGILHYNYHFKISKNINTIKIYDLYVKISDMIMKSVLQRANKFRKKLAQYILPGHE